MAEEEAEELEVVEEDTEEENVVSYTPLSPQTASTEPVQELNKAEENWFWGWLSPFSIFSGLTTVANRYRHWESGSRPCSEEGDPPGGKEGSRQQCWCASHLQEGRCYYNDMIAWEVSLQVL
ncbi:unnamed protein product [Lepidochelys kempii]